MNQQKLISELFSGNKLVKKFCQQYLELSTLVHQASNLQDFQISLNESHQACIYFHSLTQHFNALNIFGCTTSTKFALLVSEAALTH